MAGYNHLVGPNFVAGLGKYSDNRLSDKVCGQGGRILAGMELRLAVKAHRRLDGKGQFQVIQVFGFDAQAGCRRGLLLYLGDVLVLKGVDIGRLPLKIAINAQLIY